MNLGIFVGGLMLFLYGIVATLNPHTAAQAGENVAASKNYRENQEVDADSERVTYVQRWSIVAGVFGLIMIVVSILAF